MGRAATGAAAVLLLLLAGCDSPAEPDDREARPSATTGAADLGAVCDALRATVTLPAGGTVRYTARFNNPTGPATNAPVCDIEPEGAYDDVVARVPVFGRAEFDYGRYPEAQLQRLGYPEYAPGTAAELLTLDQAEPLSDEIPCVHETCRNGIHGFQYNFRFETRMDDIAVVARFDYITTDVSGDRKAEYRIQAVEAFTAAMATIAAAM
jgi:hypothetical protein